MKKLIFISQGRFWNWDNASRLRAKSAIEAMLGQGFSVRVVYLGNIDSADQSKYSETFPSEAPLSGLSTPLLQSIRADEIWWRRRAMGALEFSRWFAQRLIRKFCSKRFLNMLPKEPRWMFRLGRTLLDDSPYASATQNIQAALDEILVDFAPDIAYLRCLDTVWVAPACRARNVFSIADPQDVVHQRRDSFLRGGLTPTMFASKTLECRLLRQADAVLAIQTDDLRRFRSLLPEIPVIHFGQSFDVVPCTRMTRSEIVFGSIGSAAQPNYAALSEILEVIWPQIVARAACSVRLIIAGSAAAHVSNLPPNTTSVPTLKERCLLRRSNWILTELRFIQKGADRGGFEQI